MRFRSLSIYLLLLMLALSSVAQTAKHRVLLDVNTVLYDGWAQAIVDAQNLLTTFGSAHIEIEVVVRGPGLALLMKSDTEFADKLAMLARQGVQFSVCGQTLTSSHSSARELLPFATVVESGVGELVRRQEAGWSYIKAGY
jgi:intracellular sulfur oxidation DsrE/DsrF family protein